jgi:glycerol-3-phosphate dehydrogenase subunit B
MTFDVVVVGAGLAGLVTAAHLSELGARVAVVAKGVGAIQLAGGPIDVLGYAPDLVASPAEALTGFIADRPEHPYARIGAGGLEAAVEWFRGCMAELPYVGAVTDNMLLSTAIGAVKPSALAPEAMAAGDLRVNHRVAIAGFRALKDFHPAYVADNLRHRDGGESVAQWLEVGIAPDGPDVTPLGFARRFDDATWRRAVIGDLQGRLDGIDAVGFPAVLGLDDHAGARRDLELGLGTRVFEIPTVPPSVPGLRVLGALRRALRAASARLVIGGEVVAASTRGERVAEVVVEAAARPIAYRARDFVLATGGFGAGGLVLDSRWNAREPILGLPVAGVPGPGRERFAPGYLDEHPMSRAGLAVDDCLRPADDDGAIYGNLYAAGALLAGAVPWREKSGDGISLASGWLVAEHIAGSSS